MADFTDIPAGALKRRLPPLAVALIELARLDRPIGAWLLMFPCLWGLALSRAVSPHLYFLFAVGAVVMRGAGCTINDIVDRRIDAQVERTKGRPLPSGRISLFGAFAFLAAQLAIGLLILLQLNHTAILWGCASLVLVVIYPFMKRVTWWPQLFLGLAFNWGALMGSAAATGLVQADSYALYVAGILWTLGYDTIYAHQDMRDDARIGVRSTARRFGRAEKLPVALFYAGFIACAALAGWLNGIGTMFYAFVGAIALGAAWLAWRWNPASPPCSLAGFKANRWIGLALFAAIVLGERCG